MPNPFDWDYQNTPPASADVLDVFAILYLVVFLLGFIISAYLYYRPWTQPFGRLFRRKSVIKATGIAMWVFGVGLFFFLIRLLQIDPLTFGRPIWMWLSVLAVLAFLAMVALTWRQARAETGARYTIDRSGRRPASGVPVQKRPVRRKTTLR